MDERDPLFLIFFESRTFSVSIPRKNKMVWTAAFPAGTHAVLMDGNAILLQQMAVFIAILNHLMASASPYWTWRYESHFTRQPVTVGNLCLSRPAAKRPTRSSSRSCRPVDGSIYASPLPSNVVEPSRICNGITGNFRNIPKYDFKFQGCSSPLPMTLIPEHTQVLYLQSLHTHLVCGHLQIPGP